MPEQTEPIQMSLPYAEIKGAATQKVLREHFTRSSEEVYTIQLNLILEREGFNKRRVYKNIEELAQQLQEHGQKDPLWLNIEPDGTAYVIRGHRRLRAFKLLVENGLFPEDGLISFIPKKMTELEMLLDQELSNSGEKMQPIERAEIAYGLKHYFGEELTNAEVAKLMCCSRQQVDNLIILAQAPDVIKDQMIKQELNVKDALALIANEKKLKKMSDKQEEKAGQSSMYETPLPFDPNAQDLKDSATLENTIIEKDQFTIDHGEQELEVNGEGEVRMTSNISGDVKEGGEPLKLVGNSVKENMNDIANGREDDNGMPKFDESRIEIKQSNNIIKLLDKIDVIAEKIPNKQTSKDIQDILGWIRTDALEVRLWVHKHKPQNKSR